MSEGMMTFLKGGWGAAILVALILFLLALELRSFSARPFRTGWLLLARVVGAVLGALVLLQFAAHLMG